MNRKKAVTLLALMLLGFLLISCFKSSLIVSNPPRSLHGEGGEPAETHVAQITPGSTAPRGGGGDSGRGEPAVAVGTARAVGVASP